MAWVLVWKAVDSCHVEFLPCSYAMDWVRGGGLDVVTISDWNSLTVLTLVYVKLKLEAFWTTTWSNSSVRWVLNIFGFRNGSLELNACFMGDGKVWDDLERPSSQWCRCLFFACAGILHILTLVSYSMCMADVSLLGYMLVMYFGCFPQSVIWIVLRQKFVESDNLLNVLWMRICDGMFTSKLYRYI